VIVGDEDSVYSVDILGAGIRHELHRAPCPGENPPPEIRQGRTAKQRKEMGSPAPARGDMWRLKRADDAD